MLISNHHSQCCTAVKSIVKFSIQTEGAISGLAEIYCRLKSVFRLSDRVPESVYRPPTYTHRLKAHTVQVLLRSVMPAEIHSLHTKCTMPRMQPQADFWGLKLRIILLS